MYLTLDLNERSNYTGTDGLNYTVPKLMVKLYDDGLFDLYNLLWLVVPVSGYGAAI